MRVEMEIPRALGNKAAGRDAALYMKATEEARRRVRGGAAGLFACPLAGLRDAGVRRGWRREEGLAA
jgi:hypothetical protein